MKIIEAADLPDGEKVYLKKGRFGYTVVDPGILDHTTGKISIRKLLLGTKKMWAYAIIVIILFGLWYLGTTELISNYRTIAENPCEFCNICRNGISPTHNLSFNLSIGR